MMAPVFITAAEILTFENLGVLKFYYIEPELKDRPALKHPSFPLGMPAATVIMPREALKDIGRKMVGFLAQQDEHARYLICRNCEHCMTEECPMSPDARFDQEKDGCSRFKLKEKDETPFDSPTVTE